MEARTASAIAGAPAAAPILTGDILPERRSTHVPGHAAFGVTVRLRGLEGKAVITGRSIRSRMRCTDGQGTPVIDRAADDSQHRSNQCGAGEQANRPADPRDGGHAATGARGDAGLRALAGSDARERPGCTVRAGAA